ncbi:MAG: hypothetical protein BEN19_05900 [Epulopiscium sp. Nuni2H_MBin003]|nr:MAG: hypothetical protein BEN19_05900 [Epulopiscium sp. Nuni2H_MBin003]
MKIKKILVGPVQELCYFIVDEDTKDAVMIDPGDEAERLISYIQKEEINLRAILITHAHFDHIGAVEAIKEQTGAEIIAHRNGKKTLLDPNFNLSCMTQTPISFEADRYVDDKEMINLESMGLTFEVIFVPGHTMDGVAYYSKQLSAVFVGDIIFKNGVGRSDLPGGNAQQLIAGIQDKICTLPTETTIYPGHGFTTNVADEIQNNPYIKIG